MKYVFTGGTKEYNGKILNRIKANEDFGIVKKGDLGGWIERMSNLSGEGNCWVSDEAMVMDNSLVTGDAQVSGHSLVHNGSIIRNEAIIFGNAEISNAVISNNAQIYENAIVLNRAYIIDYARIHGNAIVGGSSVIEDDAEICGIAKILVPMHISTGAVIKDQYYDCFMITNMDPITGINLTFYRNYDGGISVHFADPIIDLNNFATDIDSFERGFADKSDVYRLAIEFARERFKQ